MLENATRICEAKFGDSVAARTATVPRRRHARRATGLCRVLTRARSAFDAECQGSPLRSRHACDKAAVHIADDSCRQTASLASLPGYGGARSLVAVPMLKDDELVGAIIIYRQEVRPFTDKQIELVHELRRPGGHRHREHAAAQRTAPAHRRSHRVAGAADRDLARCCKVISSSPGELEPVFQAMLENATRICEAKFGILYLLRRTTRYRAVAMHRRHRGIRRVPRARGRSGPAQPRALGRVATTKQTVHIDDIRRSRPTSTASRFAWRPPSSAALARCSACRCSRTTS